MFALGGCSESDGGSGTDPNDGKVAVSFVLPGIGVETGAGGAAVASDVSSGCGVAGGFASGGVARSGVSATRADGFATRAGASEPLAKGVTVRIVAFKQGTDIASAAAAGYVGQATYVAAEGSGGAIVLKPCNVTLDGDGKVSGVNETGAKPLYLLPGTYDFYAITPAFLPDDSTHASVSVAHGDDFASSLTAGVELKFGGAVVQGGSPTSGKGAVTLTTLDRKCARLNFAVSRKSEGVKKAKFRSLWVSKLATSPKNTVSIGTDITADTDTSAENMPTTPQSGGGHFSFTVPTDVQTPSAGPAGTPTLPSPTPGGTPLPAYLCAVADEVLPKTADTLHLHMEVLFNDHADKTDAEIAANPALISVLDAQLPEIDYTKDKQYNYRLILKGGSVFLELTVSNWADDLADWSVDDLGGTPQVEGIVVGTWTPSSNQNDDMGQGSASGTTGTSDWTWTPNQNWSVELGNYMQAVSQANGWTSNSADNTAMGGGGISGSAGGSDGGNWTPGGGDTDNLGQSGSGTADNGGDWTNNPADDAPMGDGSASGSSDNGGTWDGDNSGDTDNLGQSGSGTADNGGDWTNNPADDAPMGDGSASGSTGDNGGDWGGSNSADNTAMGGGGGASGSSDNGGTWDGDNSGDTDNLGQSGSGTSDNGGTWDADNTGNTDNLGGEGSGTADNGGDWTNNPADDAPMGDGSASGSAGGSDGGNWTGNPTLGDGLGSVANEEEVDA